MPLHLPPGSISAGTTRASLGEIVFSNSNGVSFGLNGQTMTASAVGAADGVNIIAAGTQTAGTTGTVVFSNSNNVTFGMTNSSQVTASVTVASTQGSFNLSAGTTSNLASAFTFSNSNGISFGLNASTITASHNAITTGRASTDAVGLATAQTNVTWTVNSAGISLNAAGYAGTGTSATNASITLDSNGLAISVGAGGAGDTRMTAFATGNTTQSSTGTIAFSSYIFRGSNIVSVGVSNGSVVVDATQSNQAFSAQGGSSTFQTLNFSNANGFTFSNSNGSIWGSYTVPTVTNSSWTVSDANVGNSASVARLVFTNLNGVTLSLSTGAAGTHTIVGSHNAITSQSNQQMTMFATGNTTLSSTGTSNASSLVFRGSGAASVGITNGSILIDVAAGAAAITQSIGMSTQTAGGATAGTTGYATGDDVLYHFVPGSNITMSQSVNGASATLSIYGAAGGGGGATISQWPIQFFTGFQTRNTGTSGATGGSTQYSVSLTAYPIVIPLALTFNRVQMSYSAATQTGTGSMTYGLWFGIYSLNGGSALSSISSANFQAVHSQDSVTARTVSWWWGTNSTSNSSSLSGNVSASFTAVRALLMSTGAASLSGGHYWIVVGHSQVSAGLNITGSSGVLGNSGYYRPSDPVFGSNTNPNQYWVGGVFSGSTNTNSTGFPVMPASVHTSQIAAFNNSNWAPLVQFLSL